MPAESLELLLREFCLTTMAARCGEMLASAETQNWGYRKCRLQLCEAEAADRRERKQQRLLPESKAAIGQDLGQLGGGATTRQGAPPVADALGRGLCRTGGERAGLRATGAGPDALPLRLGPELVLRRGYAVYFTPTFKLVPQLLAAKKDLRLEAALKKLDRFEAIILDDLVLCQSSNEG